MDSSEGSKTINYTNGHGNSDNHDIIANNVFARQLILVDEHNNPRISLFIAADGSPQVVLNDAAEHTRLEIRLETDGRPEVILRGADERIRASLTLEQDEYPCFRLRDHNDQLRACLYVAENTPALNLYDSQEKLRVCVTLEPEEGDQPYVLLYNNEEQRQVAFTVPSDGSKGLLLQDREGVDRKA